MFYNVPSGKVATPHPYPSPSPPPSTMEWKKDLMCSAYITERCPRMKHPKNVRNHPRAYNKGSTVSENHIVFIPQ